MINRLIHFVWVSGLLAGCSPGDSGVRTVLYPSQDVDFGWETEAVDLDRYTSILYVSSEGSDEDGDGSREKPYASLQKAVSSASGQIESAPGAILVAEGAYGVTEIQMKEYLDLYGGFNPENWERDIKTNRTLLSGGYQSRILTGADHCRIDGFFIMGGRHRGSGGAIYCDGSSPEISNNYFFRNQTQEPIPWNPAFIHEKAHDGGAIYAENGSSPIIRNNIFTGNETENGRGAAVAFHGHCKGKIHNNVFLHNTAGLTDGFRSSDGGAVSIFNWCRVDVVDNLFMGNRALAKNDGGALFYALWSSGRIEGNYFLNNRSMDDAGALFVGGQEHRYDRPLDPLPPPDKFFVTIDRNIFMGNANPSMNSGAFRITMESRGDFTNNLVTFNNGAYFQRSDLGIYNNTIIDNMLLVETKEGLNPCRLKNNIVLGDIRIETEVDISNCLLLDPENEKTREIEFMNDGIPLQAVGAMIGADRTETRLIVNGAHAEGSLKNRIIRAGNLFSLIKYNKGNEIIVWGDLSAERDFMIMSSFTPVPNPAVSDAGADAGLANDLYGNARITGSHPDIGAIEKQ